MANSSVVGLLKVLLTADTAQFEKALSGADSHVTKLANTMKRDLEPSQKRINMLVRDFLGTKEIGRANDYAEAVTRAGGAAKLTAADQAKVNRAVTDALAHYKALGEKAPASMVALANATKHAQIPADKLNATMVTMKGVLGAFGIQLGLSSLVGFGKSAVAAAGQIVDLSDKTGLSIKAVQVYGAVAKQTGGDLNTYADGVFKLGINLAKGGNDVEKAINGFGLSLQQLRASGSEQQFEVLAEKLRAIGDEGERNRLGVLLFGKVWKDIAPGVVAGIQNIKDATTVASDATVRAVDRAADAYDQFLTNAENKTVEFLGTVVMAASSKAGLGVLLQSILGGGANLGLALDTAGIIANAELAAKTPKKDISLDKPKRVPPELTAEMKRYASAVREMAEAWSRESTDENIAKTLAAAKEFVRLGLTPNEDAIKKLTLQVDEWLRAGFEVPDMLMRVRDENIELVASIFPVGKGLDGLTLSARNYIHEMRKVGDAQKPFSAAVKQFTDLINKSKTMSLFSGGISGIDVSATGDTERTKAAERAKALDAWNQRLRLTSDLMARAAQQGTGMFGAFARGAQFALSAVDQYVTGLRTMTAAASAANVAMGVATMGLSFIIGGIANVFAEEAASAKAAAAAIRELKKAIEDLGGVPITPEEHRAYLDALRATGQVVSVFSMRSTGYAAALKRQRDALVAAQEQMRGLTAATEVFGGVAPKALHGLINELLTSKHLTADMRKELEAMTGAPTWQVMQERAEKLGIALSALGTNFSQARISDIALQYVRDLNMFSEAGADADSVLRGMADELSTVAQEAITSGAALPKTLEPYMKRLAEMGLLLNANGELIDMGALSFKDIEDEALKQMVSFLEEIRDLLKEIGRISIGAPQVPVTAFGGGVAPRAPRFSSPGFDAGIDSAQLPSFAGGTRGAYMDFGPGTPVMLHGQERVSTRGEGSGGTFNIYAIDAPSFETFLKQRGGAEAVVRSLPPVVERWGGAR